MGTTFSPNLETPPSSPSLHRNDLINNDDNQSSRTTSLNSTPSRTSSDDDSRLCNSQMNSITFIGGVTTRQTISNIQRPPTNNSINGSPFKMMSISGNICPRCSKTVYSAEEVKAAGKVLSFLFVCLFVYKILFLVIS